MSKRACLYGLAGLVAVTMFATNGSSASSAATEAGSQPSIRPLITGGINDGNLVTLWGNTRPEATANNDLGPLPDSFVMDHLILQLKHSPEQEQKLDSLILQLHDKNSPLFHHWLTPEQFGERFGLGQEDLEMIKGWLQSHGLTVNFVYSSNLVIDFSGTAGQIKDAFHTELHQLSVNGKKHYANMTDPRIPAALAPVVVGVVSLNDSRRTRNSSTPSEIRCPAFVPILPLALIAGTSPRCATPPPIAKR